MRLRARVPATVANLGSAFDAAALAMVYRTAGGWRSERVDPSPDIRPVLLIPTSERVSTGAARVAVPRSVDLDDAVFNLSRSALLALAFTDRPELLANALDDRLHQRHRLPLMPVAASKLDELRGDGIPACIAGSGPVVPALETDQRPDKDAGQGRW